MKIPPRPARGRARTPPRKIITFHAPYPDGIALIRLFSVITCKRKGHGLHARSCGLRRRRRAGPRVRAAAGRVTAGRGRPAAVPPSRRRGGFRDRGGPLEPCDSLCPPTLDFGSFETFTVNCGQTVVFCMVFHPVRCPRYENFLRPPRCVWLCVLPRGQLNVNVSVK